jgi:hypothetical protein
MSVKKERCDGSGTGGRRQGKQLRKSYGKRKEVGKIVSRQWDKEEEKLQ